MPFLQTKPYMNTYQDVQRLQSLGVLISINATLEQTGGIFNLFEVLCPIKYETPLHIHYAEDVAIFVVGGALEIFWGKEKKNAPPGSFFFHPKGTPHGFRVHGKSPARILYITIPAGFDRYVLECSNSTSNFGKVAAARYKIEILGPLSDSEKFKE